MKTTLIKTTGQTMTAACFGMPAASVSFVAPITSGLGGFEGSDLSALRTMARDERPMSAFVAAGAANQGVVYAAGAGNHQQRAFRGPEPWRERT